MYTVYNIESTKNGRKYIGVTSNLSNRLRQHNSGANKSTRPNRPWKLRHKETFEEKSDAWKREKQIKKIQGRKCIFKTS